MVNSISVIGGDMRQIYLSNMLAGKADVTIFANKSKQLNKKITVVDSLEEAVNNSNIIVCPIPFTKDGQHVYANNSNEKIHYKDLFSFLSEKKILLAGPFKQPIVDYAKEKKVNLIDIAKTIRFAKLNALPTAEGVISIMLNSLDITLSDGKCLILGFGNCGKSIAKLTKGFNMQVTIASVRKEELLEARVNGYQTVYLSEKNIHLEEYNYVINTIPVQLLDISINKNLEDYVFIEIANVYEDHKNKFVNARGIPGRYSPKSTSKIIYTVVLESLFEKGVII